VYHYLSGAQTRRLGFLQSQAPEPWVEIHPQAALRLGIANHQRVRVRTPRGTLELKALVVATIRPDTLFIPFHYGHTEAVNQVTNPAVERMVKIPEYKVCAAAIEPLDAPAAASTENAQQNFTPEMAPRMFPYTVGETKASPEQEGKKY
jgi:assimilatory nitrate reductase catalytic subunit